VTTYTDTTALPVIDVVPESSSELVPVSAAPLAVPVADLAARADVGATDHRRRDRRRVIAAGSAATALAALWVAGYLLGTSALGAAIAAYAIKTAAILVAAWYLITRIHGHRCRCLICGG
jgi:hypothetical protein